MRRLQGPAEQAQVVPLRCQNPSLNFALTVLFSLIGIYFLFLHLFSLALPRQTGYTLRSFRDPLLENMTYICTAIDREMLLAVQEASMPPGLRGGGRISRVDLPQFGETPRSSFQTGRFSVNSVSTSLGKTRIRRPRFRRFGEKRGLLPEMSEDFPETIALDRRVV